MDLFTKRVKVAPRVPLNPKSAYNLAGFSVDKNNMSYFCLLCIFSYKNFGRHTNVHSAEPHCHRWA